MNHEVPALHGTLVLVHGIFDTGRIFVRMTRHFAARGLRVLAPDLKPSSGEVYCKHRTHFMKGTTH